MHADDAAAVLSSVAETQEMCTASSDAAVSLPTEEIQEICTSLASLSTANHAPCNADNSTSQQHHPDAMREVRAMIVAALPCLPMPMMASSGVGTLKSTACSSHDLIAHLMNIACTCATEKQNAARALLQSRLQAELFEEVDAWKEKQGNCGTVLPSADWCYQTLGRFTRKYIQSYMPDPEKDQDVRFIPMHDVDRCHAVHASAAQFHKGQDVLYGKCRMLTVNKEGKEYVRGYDTISYGEMVCLSVARILDS